MARPLRVEYPGAVYHVTSRGHARHGSLLACLVCLVHLVYLVRFSLFGNRDRRQEQFLLAGP